jgi:uncharacterized integral membrane protein
MMFLFMLTALALAVAVGALQNGEAVTVSFLLWQFDAPLAAVILLSAAGGLIMGTLVGWARAVRGWRHRATATRDPARPHIASSQEDTRTTAPSRTPAPR